MGTKNFIFLHKHTAVYSHIIMFISYHGVEFQFKI